MGGTSSAIRAPRTPPPRGPYTAAAALVWFMATHPAGVVFPVAGAPLPEGWTALAAPPFTDTIVSVGAAPARPPPAPGVEAVLLRPAGAPGRLHLAGGVHPAVAADIMRRFPRGRGRRRGGAPRGFAGPSYRSFATANQLGAIDSIQVAGHPFGDPSIVAPLTEATAAIARVYALLTLEKRKAFWAHGGTVKELAPFTEVTAFKMSPLGGYLEQLCMPHKNNVMVVLGAELIVEALRALCGATAPAAGRPVADNLERLAIAEAPGRTEPWLPGAYTLAGMSVAGGAVKCRPDMLFTYVEDGAGSVLWVCAVGGGWDSAVQTAIAVFMGYGGATPVRAVLISTATTTPGATNIVDPAAGRYTVQASAVLDAPAARAYYTRLLATATTPPAYYDATTGRRATRQPRYNPTGPSQTIPARAAWARPLL